MPQAGGEPDGEQRQDQFAGPFPGSAHGDIDVIPEPASQGHVPAPPEFRDAFGHVGKIKIFLQLEAKQIGHADGHIHVPGKIEVNIKGEGKDAHPGKEHGQARRIRISGDGPERSQRIGDEHFFEQTDGEAFGPFRHERRPDQARFQLRGDLIPAHDGPGGQLGEHQEIQGQPVGGFLSAIAPVVYIDDIGQDLEGEKGDPQGLRQPFTEKLGAKDTVEVGEEEPQVFEDEQDQEVKGEDPDEQGLAQGRDQDPVHGQGEAVVDQYGDRHQRDVSRAAPAEKQDA